MLTHQFKKELIISGIYENAVKLSEVKGYKEKQSTLPYHLCNSILVDHNQKAFWFTDKKTAQHTLSLNN
tara:strand:- start:4845 stop:5051 length:207 start_codon:yes stop_codon:yes gene_type:complete